jgi:hypothetical protein
MSDQAYCHVCDELCHPVEYDGEARKPKCLDCLILERDNYKSDALAYLNTISEADDDVHYMRRKLAVALWIINHFPLNKDSKQVLDEWLTDMRSIGIEPSVE